MLRNLGAWPQLTPLFSSSAAPGLASGSGRTCARGIPRGSSVAHYPKRADASLADYAAAALSGAPDEFVVVAHSVGGVVGAQLLSDVPDRVKGFIGIAAAIPIPGRSFFASLPFPASMVLSAITRMAGTRPPDKAIRGTLAAGLRETTANRIVTEFAPESQALYRHRVGPRRVPPSRGYLETTNDKEMSHTLQQRFANNLDARWRATLPTGHLPMLEDASATAAAIENFLATNV